MYSNQFVTNANTLTWEVVVAQLVERSILTLEARGLNPVIGKNLYRTFTVNYTIKTKIKKKRPGMAHLKKITLSLEHCIIGETVIITSLILPFLVVFITI